MKAVIFDHDGTLVDSEPLTLGVLAEMAIEAGAEVYPDDVDRFVGADLKLVLDEIERRSGAPLRPDFMEEFRRRQTAQIEAGLEAIPGAAELLAALDVPVAVASNAPVDKMELCLGAAGLRQFFTTEVLCSAYDVGAWKPDPGVFLWAAEVLGVAPADCVVVEDSAPGIEGARAAGMRVWALDRKGRFADLDGVETVGDLAELIPILT